MGRLIRTSWLALTIMSLSGTALACPVLVSAEPKVGSTVGAPVTHVSLLFSDKVIADKSTIDIRGPQGDVPAGKLTASADEMRLTTEVKPLGTGRYTVSWHVLCACGSIIPGSYKFTVE